MNPEQHQHDNNVVLNVAISRLRVILLPTSTGGRSVHILYSGKSRKKADAFYQMNRIQSLLN